MQPTPAYPEREIVVSEGGGAQGALWLGECARLAPQLLARHAGRVQLIYMDPPFFTGEVREMRMRVGDDDWARGAYSLRAQAYDDRFESDQAYFSMLREALRLAHALLSPQGTIFVHIDYRMSARVRLLLDEVFGEANFLNEIVWRYQTGGRAQRFFSRKHDTILFYRKSARYFFNLRAVPIPRAGNRDNHMKRHVALDGRTFRTIKSGGKIYTYFDDQPTYPDDVWDDVSHLQQKDPQRTGFDTQKPLSLLTRIVQCASRPGDTVCDLFCGSGTTLEAAARLGRGFLGVDSSAYAREISRKRLLEGRLRVESAADLGSPDVRAHLGPVKLTSLEVRLTSFTLEPGRVPALTPPREIWAALDAVDNWSCGYMRDGAFHAYAHELRTARKPRLAGVLELPLYDGQPCIRVSDVLGRCFYYTFPNEYTFKSE